MAEVRLTVRFPAHLMAQVRAMKPLLHRYLQHQGRPLAGNVIPTDADFIRIATVALLELLAADSNLKLAPNPTPELFPDLVPQTKSKKVKMKPVGKMPFPSDFVLLPRLKEYAMFHLGITGTETDDLWAEFSSFHTARASLFKDWEKAWQNRILALKTQQTRYARMQPKPREPAATFEQRIKKAQDRLAGR